MIYSKEKWELLIWKAGVAEHLSPYRYLGFERWLDRLIAFQLGSSMHNEAEKPRDWIFHLQL